MQADSANNLTKINSRNNFDLSFLTNNTEAIRLTTAGRFGIGTTSPTAILHLKAGTATANTAPLKLTSGTNLTTAEAGTWEYNGTSLFFSPSTTRLRTVLTDNSIPSNGQLPIGNGTNYTNANITGSKGVTVTNGSGTIDISTPNSPTIVASSELTSQSAATNIVTYTTGAADSTYMITARVNITALTAGTLQTQVTYTDETNASRTLIFYGMGTTSAGLTTTGVSNYAPIAEIRVKASTTITLQTLATVTLVGVTYNAGGTIIKIR